jgi:hypothetical protein
MQQQAECFEIEQCFSIIPSLQSPLYHTVKASENDAGQQAIIVRNVVSAQHLPPHFACDAARVHALMEGRPHMLPDLVFLQYCKPAHAFKAYEHTSDRLVISGEHYLKLLSFFGNEWERVYAKMCIEIEKMQLGTEFIRIAHNLYFKGPGIIVYTRIIDDRLQLKIRYESECGLLSAELRFEGKDAEVLGRCPVNVRSMCMLATGRAHLDSLLTKVSHEYKEPQTKKMKL